MPRISYFFGISIYLYYADHAPPHFHARYNDDDVAIEIQSLAVLVGAIPPRAHALVVEWARQHQTELLHAWECCRRDQAPPPIPPLQ